MQLFRPRLEVTFAKQYDPWPCLGTAGRQRESQTFGSNEEFTVHSAAPFENQTPAETDVAQHKVAATPKKLFQRGICDVELGTPVFNAAPLPDADCKPTTRILKAQKKKSSP